jgi:hypothetical protein
MVSNKLNNAYMEKENKPLLFNTPINYLKPHRRGSLQLQLHIRRKKERVKVGGGATIKWTFLYNE